MSGGGVMEDGRVSPTLWYSTPPPDDIDPDTELVSQHSFVTLNLCYSQVVGVDWLGNLTNYKEDM